MSFHQVAVLHVLIAQARRDQAPFSWLSTRQVCQPRSVYFTPVVKA